jgi:ABC-2 type transport system permease protein
VVDAWTIARRDLAHWRLRPGSVLVGWLFPVMLALMFGGLFGGAIEVPGGGSYFEVLMPGLFAMTMLFGVETTMVAVATDAQKEVTDRFRSLAISSASVVLGRCIADLLSSVVGLAVLGGAALALGWRWHGDAGAVAAAFGLLLLLRFAVLWIGIYLGLLARGPESVMAVQILVWPIGFLSRVFVDPSTMPPGLAAIAAWNPISVTASAIRALFGNPGTGSLAHAAIGLAIAWPVVLMAVFAPLAARRYRSRAR